MSVGIENLRRALRDVYWRSLEVFDTGIKGETLRDFDVVDEDTLVLGTDKGLYVSTDGGRSWRKIASGRTDCVKATRTVAEKVFATFSDGNAVLYEVVDLERLVERYRGPEGDRILAMAENSDYIFFSGYGNKDGFGNAVFRSPDGVTWEKTWEIPAESDERHIHELHTSPELLEVWITTGDSWFCPWVSEDNGATFTRLRDHDRYYGVNFRRDDHVGELTVYATPRAVFCGVLYQIPLHYGRGYGALAKQLRIPRPAPFVPLENVFKNVAQSIHGFVFKTLWGRPEGYRRGPGGLFMTDDYGQTWYEVLPLANYLALPRAFKDMLYVVATPTGGLGYGRTLIIKMPIWQAVEMARRVPALDIPIGTFPSLSGTCYFGEGELTYPVSFGKYERAVVRVTVDGAVDIEVYASTLGFFTSDHTALHDDDKLIDTISFTGAGTKVVSYENVGWLRFRAASTRNTNIQVYLY